MKKQIRWVESPARDAQGLLDDLVRELQFLTAADPAAVETTLLIRPHAPPHPMLHLLRDDSIARAVAAFPDTPTIYECNIETLRRLGVDGWRQLMSKAG